MKNQNKLFLSLIFLLTSAFCTAQVEPFTKYYNLDPDWVGNYFEQIIHTPDGGYAAVFNQNQGFTMRTSLLKLDQYGEVEWQTIVEDTSYLNVNGFTLCMDNNDNYYLAGNVQVVFNEEYAQYDALLVKFDTDGNLLWHKNYNLNSENVGTSDGINRIIATDENKIIAVGAQNYCGESVFSKSLIICFNEDGEEMWKIDDCSIDYTVEMTKSLLSITESQDGYFYAIGSTVIPTWVEDKIGYSNYQGIVFKFNDEGETIFRKVFGRPSYQAYFTDICEISSDNFAVTGWISDTSGVLQNYEDMQTLFIFDSSFNVKYQHNKFVGGGSSKQKISLSRDSVLYVIAATEVLKIDPETEYKNDLLILKYSKKGELLWHKFIGGQNVDISNGHMCLTTDEDNGATFGFYEYDYTTKYTYAAVLMKIDSLGNGIYNESDFPYPDSSEYIIYNTDKPINSTNNVNIYPNPAKDGLIVNIPANLINAEFKVFSITGRLVIDRILKNTQNRIDISHLKNGIYISMIKKDETVIYRKVVVSN